VLLLLFRRIGVGKHVDLHDDFAGRGVVGVGVGGLFEEPAGFGGVDLLCLLRGGHQHVCRAEEDAEPKPGDVEEVVGEKRPR